MEVAASEVVRGDEIELDSGNHARVSTTWALSDGQWIAHLGGAYIYAKLPSRVYVLREVAKPIVDLRPSGWLGGGAA
jgi:hypothetical protein